MEYSTSQIAQIFGIHTNTVRFYEDMGLLPKAERRYNGYRVFNDRHIEQIKLIRTAFKEEAVKGNLRKRIVKIVRLSAAGAYEEAEEEAGLYFLQLVKLKSRAYDAANYVREQGFEKDAAINEIYSKNEIMEILDINSEALRHWERSGLIRYPRNSRGHIYFTKQELRLLGVISTLRQGDCSVEEISKMLVGIGGNERKSTKTDTWVLANAGEEPETAIDNILKSLAMAVENYAEIRIALISCKKQSIQ